MIERHPTPDGVLHPLRPSDITASVMAALYRMHPWKTPLALYNEKTGAAVAPQKPSKAIRRGHIFEDAVATAVRLDRPDWTITPAREYLRDPDIRLGATPDFYMIDEHGRRGVLQAKTVGFDSFKKYWTPHEPPPWVCIQVLTEMLLDDSQIGWIAALVDNYAKDLHLYFVPRRTDAEHRIRDGAKQFWVDVANGVVPKPDYARDLELLQLLYPQEVPAKEVDLRADNRVPGLLAKRARMLSLMRLAKAKKDAVDAELRHKMADAEIALVDRWNVKLKRVRVVHKAREQYETNHRRFFISPKKDDVWTPDDDETEEPSA